MSLALIWIQSTGIDSSNATEYVPVAFKLFRVEVIRHDLVALLIIPQA